MANDPTLLRPMFNSVQPTLPLQQLSSPGISALPRPDVEAQNLRNLFTPTPEDTSMGQPVQSFQVGGEVMSTPLAMRNLGASEGIAQIEIPPMLEPSLGEGASTYTPRTPFGRGLRDFFTPSGKALENIESAQKSREQQEALDRVRRENRVPTVFEEVTDEERQAAIRAQQEAIAATLGTTRPPVDMFTGTGGGETYSPDPSRSVMSQLGEGAAPLPPAPAREPVKPQGELELSLEAIRARRAEDRKENALLALMQAGFATAAGQSPNALSNIGAGGQAGIAAFAGMERSSREDQRAAMQDLAARRREMSAESLAREKMAQDPDVIRTARILGKGDIERGLAILNSDKKLQAAIAISKDLTADEGARKEAVEFLRISLLNAGAGKGGGFTGFSARPVSQ